jgi:hypothetical protein
MQDPRQHRDKRHVPKSIFNAEVQEQMKRATPSASQSQILGAMQGKHVYAGTVSEKEALHRLKQKKAQKRARRLNRR